MTVPQNTAVVAVAPGGNPVLRLLIDLSAAVVLCAILAGVYAFDPKRSAVPPPPEPKGDLPSPISTPPTRPKPPDITTILRPIDPEPRIKVSGWMPDGRFGVMTTTGDPNDPNDDDKQLTYSSLPSFPPGRSSNTCVWVDDATPLFGSNSGVWHERIDRRAGRFTCAWDYKGVRFEQIVELEHGEVSRRMDTLRITYAMTNNSDRPHVVGIRAMIDTLIVGNDGAPFRSPTRADAIILQPTVFPSVEVPPYIHAMQNNSLENPGVVVSIGGLRPTGGEAASEVVLSHWPNENASWRYDREAPFAGDTAVGVYYLPQPLEKGAKRTVSFTYGLATQSRDKFLTLTPGEAPKAGGEFYLTSLVQQPKKGQTVTLTLPAGMKLKDLTKKTQQVPEGGDFQQINWHVLVDRNAPLGDREASVRLEPDGKEKSATLTVQPADSRLFLEVSPPKKAGERGFWVTGRVRAPKVGQTLELKGTNVAGKSLLLNDASQQVPVAKGYVQWWVSVDPSDNGTVDLRATLSSGDGKEPLHAETKVAVKGGVPNIFGN